MNNNNQIVGSDFDQESKKTAIHAIKKLAGQAPVSIEPIKMSTYMNRIIWKTKAPDKDWKITTNLNSMKGTHLKIRPASTCLMCHADDHHNMFCQWKAVIPGNIFLPKKANRLA